jgi:hypothetical protein
VEELFILAYKKMKTKLIYLLLILGIFSQCKETTTEELNFEFGYDYFLNPVVGKYIEYKVDTLYIDDSGNFTVSKFVREEVRDFFINEQEDTVYRIEQFVKDSLEGNWSIASVLSLSIENDQAIKTEGNLKFLKMVFPPRENTTFEPTKFIDDRIEVKIGTEFVEMYKNWDGEIESVDTPDAIGNLNFPEVLTITYADDNNLVERRFFQEKYVKGIGLAYKSIEILDDAENPNEAIAWIDRAEKGFIATWEIIDFN